MSGLETEVLVVGSGAGGATTAATLAEAGRDVVVLEEGPWVEPDAVEPFSLEEMVTKYRHHGSSAALGNPPVAYAEGRCVGGSTCLLYTSPSPRDRTRSRMPSSA